MIYLLKDTFNAAEFFPVLGGRTILVLFEHSVKIGYIVKPALEGDLCNTQVFFYQPAGGISYSGIIYVFYEGFSCSLLYKAVKGNGAHVHHIGDLRKGDPALIVFLHVLVDHFDLIAVLEILVFGSITGQQSLISGICQVLKYGDKLQEIINTVNLGEPHDLWRHFM